MVGPRRRPVATERRRHGRRRVWARSILRLGVPMVVSAVVVVLGASAVAQIGRASGPYRRTVDQGYAALAAPLAAQSDATGAALVSFLGDAPSLGRVAFFSDLSTLVADADAVTRRYGGLTPPNPVTGAACARALIGRARAVESLQSTLEGVLGGRTGTGTGGVDEAAATGALVQAGSVLRSADASWATCRRALRRAPGSAVLPASVWMRDPAVLGPAGAGRLVSQVVDSRSLAPVHDLALVALVTEPTAVASAQTLVVRATTAVVTSVVVANRGNVDEQQVEIGGAVTLQGAPANAVLVQRTVDLAAGRSTTITLRRFFVQPGSSYTVQVDAESPGSSGQLASDSVQVEVQQAATLTSVSSVPVAGVEGRPVTFTAGLTPALSGVGTPTGTVAFDDDGATIPGCGAQPVRADQATCTTTYTSASAHAITAAYSGDARFAGSMSPAITLVVAQ